MPEIYAGKSLSEDVFRVIIAFENLTWVAGVQKGRGRELGRENTREGGRTLSRAPKYPFPFQRRPRRLSRTECNWTEPFLLLCPK